MLSTWQAYAANMAYPATKGLKLISVSKNKFWPSSVRRTQNWRRRQGKQATIYLPPERLTLIDVEAKKRGVSRKKLLASLVEWAYRRRGNGGPSQSKAGGAGDRKHEVNITVSVWYQSAIRTKSSAELR